MTLTKKQHSELSKNDCLILNLHNFIFQAKIHEAELARQTSIPQPTLHKILTGKTQDPRMSTLHTLANYFGVTIDALYADVALKNNHISLKGKPIPVISWIDAIRYRETLKKLTPDNWEHWVIINSSQGDQLFALKSKVYTEPRFPRDTLFIVDPQTTPTDGDLVIAHFPETKECTLRELSIDGRAELLLPLNINTRSDKLIKSIKIIGVVLQARFSFQSDVNFC